jgi:hypothetical protein
MQLWHMACILPLCAGCYFWPPLEVESLNDPPEIQTSDPPLGEALVIDIPQVIAFVVVTDESPDDLEYTWTISGLGDQGTAVPMLGNNVYGSKLTLQRDPVYDGRILRCRVTDSAQLSAEMEWEITVVEDL